MNNSVNVSLPFSKIANEVMKEVVKKAKDYDTEIKQVDSTCWEWYVSYEDLEWFVSYEDLELKKPDQIQELILEFFTESGIPTEEFYFEYYT